MRVLLPKRNAGHRTYGFSDVGCYGSEIKTPNIDRLASEGLRLLNHHAAAACSPTRAMLMSGTDAHLGGLGVLIEYKKSKRGAQRFSGKAGYEGYLNNNVATLPEILGDNGYFTAMSGKWHLGMRANQGPWARGFQNALAMLPGCCNHYGWEPVQERFPYGGSPIHAENGTKVDIPANKTENPGGFYSTDYYTDKMIQYLENRYKGVYDDGPYALRDRRLESLVEMGIIDESVIPHKVETSTTGSGEWDELTAEERKLSSRAMETYAGMVDSMDMNIGKMVEYLKRTGEYDNTFIVFMSDNGAEGAALEAIPVMGEKITSAIHQYYDNSLDNIGAWNSFTWLGPLWAQASTAPSRLFKGFPSQGGILVPCIVKPPSNTFLPSFMPGSYNRSFSTVMDFLPTFLELAGIAQPPASEESLVIGLSGNITASRKMATFRGKAVHAIRGKSWVPFFSQGKQVEEDETWSIHSSSEPIGWELFARAALRKGDWKIVHISKAQGGVGVDDEGWELFNVADDPGETKDLAQSQPEKLAELRVHWDEYVVECGLVWGEGALAPGLGREEAPELWEDEVELQKSLMGAKVGSCPDSCL
ncbi:alkaline-phosphatase-like protein [Penicillium canariense]|uniref:Alkaline-phosphatase-like protein n=1 Tax=Penicillium canariense TaxID=189055 RepID=A0A9W9HQ84_9EURO|nr:alkaline-phosphatase-like protein [Penicillium canariense]KAJ5153377.1 alkaline-phosphatase-like protein [Penicillium canariense]